MSRSSVEPLSTTLGGNNDLLPQTMCIILQKKKIQSIHVSE